LQLFGKVGLKAVRPILSFKILSNMPFCFVSINENIQGPNGIYTPWEGNGAQAIEAGIRAIQAGDARCALVGGCDVKTHELAFTSLQQQGIFFAWRESGNGIVPGEGAAFLVLENEENALARGARTYGFVSAASLRSASREKAMAQTRTEVLQGLNTAGAVSTLVSSSVGDESRDCQEESLLSSAQLSANSIIRPKPLVGDLFAAAALLQLGLGALLAESHRARVLVNCFGHGCTQAAFLVDAV